MRIKKSKPQKAMDGLCFEFGVLFSFMINYNSMKIFLFFSEFGTRSMVKTVTESRKD